MSVSAHIAAQRTDHGVPHAVSCRALGVAASTFYKWRCRPPTPAKRRRAELDVEVRACSYASYGTVRLERGGGDDPAHAQDGPSPGSNLKTRWLSASVTPGPA